VSTQTVAAKPHSPLMLPTRITFPHFSVSSTSSLSKSAATCRKQVARSEIRIVRMWDSGVLSSEVIVRGVSADHFRPLAQRA
jgi:hypothetical protein